MILKTETEENLDEKGGNSDVMNTAKTKGEKK